MRSFHLPTRIHLRPGARAELGDLVRQGGHRSVLLVVDPGLAATPWPDEIRSDLAAFDVACVSFDDVPANPRVTTAEAAADAARSEKVDAVVGLGGGSALDTAKAAAMLASNTGDAHAYEGRERYERRPLPVFAVPTTCGTGSEVTWVSVLTDERSRRKISVKGAGMFPVHALVDADLVSTLPSRLVAWTGMDAFTHALEATTCSVRNPVSDALAETALRLLLGFLPRAVADPAGDATAREAVMRAATLAGMAFGNADVAGVHCLSESIGGLFDRPHGLVNAILVGSVLRSHLDAVAGRLAELQRVTQTVDDAETPGPDAPDAPDAEAAARFLGRLDALTATVDVPAFSTLDIPRDAHEDIARLAVENGSNGSNPRPMGVREYLDILDGFARVATG